MTYLLDTHTFLWMAGDPTSLSANVRKIVEEVSQRLYLSAASAWEIALLHQLKRVDLPDAPQRFIPEAMQRLSVLPIPIGFTTAISAATLPLIHRDPFDRLIIAEALKEKMTILTRDNLFKAYGVQSLW
jgi:PIN domain nuclease of toxin-antitoxin system